MTGRRVLALFLFLLAFTLDLSPAFAASGTGFWYLARGRNVCGPESERDVSLRGRVEAAWL